MATLPIYIKINNVDEFNKNGLLPIINDVITSDNNLFKVGENHLFKEDVYNCENIYNKKIYSVNKDNFIELDPDYENDIIEIKNYEHIENIKNKIKVNNIATSVLRSLDLSKYFYTYDNLIGDKWFIIKNWFVNPDYQRIGIGTNQLLYLIFTLKVDFIYIYDISSKAINYWMKFVNYKFGGAYYNKPLNIGGKSDIRISYPTLHYLNAKNYIATKKNLYKCLSIEKNI